MSVRQCADPDHQEIPLETLYFAGPFYREKFLGWEDCPDYWVPMTVFINGEVFDCENEDEPWTDAQGRELYLEGTEDWTSFWYAEARHPSHRCTEWEEVPAKVWHQFDVGYKP